MLSVQSERMQYLYDLATPTENSYGVLADSSTDAPFEVPWDSTRYDIGNSEANLYGASTQRNVAWDPQFYATQASNNQDPQLWNPQVYDIQVQNNETPQLLNRNIYTLDLEEHENNQAPKPPVMSSRSRWSWKQNALAILGVGAVGACAAIPFILKATSSATLAPVAASGAAQDCAGEELLHAYTNLTAVASELAGQVLPLSFLNGTLCNMTAVLQNVAGFVTPYLAASCVE